MKKISFLSLAVCSSLLFLFSFTNNDFPNCNVIGDSVVYGVGTTQQNNRWANLICNFTSKNGNIIGVPGMTISQNGVNSGNNYVFSNTPSKIFTNDVLVWEFGFNDAHFSNFNSFDSAYQAVWTYSKNSKAWSYNDMYLIWNYTNNSTGLKVKYDSFMTITSAHAIAKGIHVIDCRNMIGGNRNIDTLNGANGIHLNNYGNINAANYISNVLKGNY